MMEEEGSFWRGERFMGEVHDGGGETFMLDWEVHVGGGRGSWGEVYDAGEEVHVGEGGSCWRIGGSWGGSS